MQSLVTYREQQYDNKRTFELFPDRLVIRGTQTFGPDFDAEVPLIDLNLRPDRLRVRNSHFKSGMTIVGICTLVVVFLTLNSHQSFLSEPVLILSAFGFCGLIVMAATFRKAQFLVFKTVAGVIVFDIARNEKRPEEFDAFIQRLTEQISKVRPSASS